jgi:hypothetical protein
LLVKRLLFAHRTLVNPLRSQFHGSCAPIDDRIVMP